MRFLSICSILCLLFPFASPVLSQEIPPPPETGVSAVSPAETVLPTGPQEVTEPATTVVSPVMTLVQPTGTEAAPSPAAVPAETPLIPTPDASVPPAAVVAPTTVTQASPAGAGSTRWWVGVGSGFSGVSLGEAERNLELILRSELDIYFDTLGLIGSYVDGTPLAEIQEVTGGLYVSSEVGYRLNKTLGVGVRGFRGFYPDLVAHLEGRGTGGEYLDETYTFSVDVSKIMAGVTAGRQPAGSPFSFHLAAFAGPVFFSSDMDYSLEYRLPMWGIDDRVSWTVPYGGTGLAADLGLDAGYAFLPGFEVYAEGGYSLANVDRVEVREDVDADGDGTPEYVSGEILADASDSPVRVDLSGLRAGGGLRYRF